MQGISLAAAASEDRCIDNLAALHDKFASLDEAERTENGKLQVQRNFAATLIELSNNPICVNHPLRREAIVSQAQKLLDADSRGRRTALPKLNWPYYYASGDAAKAATARRNRPLSTKECTDEIQRLTAYERQEAAPSLANKMTFARARLELFEGSCRNDARATAQISAAYEFLDSVGARTVGRPNGQNSPAVAPQEAAPKISSASVDLAECVSEVQRIQMDATRRVNAAGSANERAQIAAAYQGVPQRRLFTGSCASHPQATAYVRTADEIIAKGERTGGSTGQASDSPSPSLRAGADGAAPATETATGSNSQPAMECLSVSPTANNGWFSMKNLCSYIISVSWCYAGTRDCKHGDWGYTNTGNISAGGTRSASTFISRAERGGLVYAVCAGRDVYIQETGPKAFTCK